MTETRGFTLLEVLVALAVVAIALAAVIRIGGSAALNAARLEDKTFADWVALNRLEELRLATSWPSTGSLSGTEEMGGRVWRWTQRVQSTEDEYVRKVEIQVARDDAPDAPVDSVTGFVGRPPPASPGQRGG